MKTTDLGTPLNYNDHVSIQLGVLIVDWTLIINVLLGMSQNENPTIIDNHLTNLYSFPRLTKPAATCCEFIVRKQTNK